MSDPLYAKGEFLTHLIVEDTGDGEHWLLHEPLVYRARSGVKYTVPAGKITDLFSIPRAVRGLLPKSEKGNAAAVIHDGAYSREISPLVADRGTADGLLNEAMEACGVGAFRRRLIFIGVRVGGHWAWAEKQQKAEAQS
jgi:hypothetical protein